MTTSILTSELGLGVYFGDACAAHGARIARAPRTSLLPICTARCRYCQ